MSRKNLNWFDKDSLEGAIVYNLQLRPVFLVSRRLVKVNGYNGIFLS